MEGQHVDQEARGLRFVLPAKLEFHVRSANYPDDDCFGLDQPARVLKKTATDDFLSLVIRDLGSPPENAMRWNCPA